MRFYPDTLFGRLIAALLAVIVITAIVVVILVMRERREMVFWGGDSSGLIEVLANTSEELAAMSPADRDGRLEVLRRDAIRYAADVERPQRRAPQWDDDAAARSYEKRLRRELGRDYEVDVKPARRGSRDVVRIDTRRGPDPQQMQPAPDRPNGPLPRGRDRPHDLDVTVRLPGGGEVTYRVPAPRSGPPLPRGIFLELAVLTVVLTAVLFVMARGITRPLRALAGAAEAMSRGEHPDPLPESGARELREATHAFNTMHERLQRYLDSRTQLLAAMSHDLRTPLTRLRLRSERIPDTELRERFVRDVDEMTHMIRATLELFRGMNGDEPPVAVDIMEFLAMLQGEFSEMGHAVDIEGSSSAPIDMKPKALKRCLENLVSNAIKFGGSARIIVSDGDALTLRVLDDGPGIPPDKLEAVFRPFFRLEDSRNPETGGTGLGLSIARDVAQSHGGTLELRNREPQGLEAILTLPRRA